MVTRCSCVLTSHENLYFWRAFLILIFFIIYIYINLSISFEKRSQNILLIDDKCYVKFLDCLRLLTFCFCLYHFVTLFLPSKYCLFYSAVFFYFDLVKIHRSTLCYISDLDLLDNMWFFRNLFVLVCIRCLGSWHLLLQCWTGKLDREVVLTVLFVQSNILSKKSSADSSHCFEDTKILVIL